VSIVHRAGVIKPDEHEPVEGVLDGFEHIVTRVVPLGVGPSSKEVTGIPYSPYVMVLSLSASFSIAVCIVAAGRPCLQITSIRSGHKAGESRVQARFTIRIR
jgi:hypothetical protein